MNDNNNNVAVNATIENVSEYKIGHTTYIVKLHFNPAFQERLSDILKRLIINDCEELLGESGQEPEKQAV
ncbi:MAG: transposon-encoded TnpW family protein [Ruminococcus sp.]|nr:transposon-encoded TnpW family protein [Ruminococcus sp.]